MTSDRSRSDRHTNYLVLFLKGMAMGAADSVPGVSGGTIAVITGIYERLIHAIRSVDARALRLLVTEGAGRAWHYIDGSYLLVLGCGILISLRLSAGLVLNLLENNFEILMGFFMGLVLASSWYLKGNCGHWTWISSGLLLAGMALTLLVSNLSPYSADIGYGYLFFCGAIAICAMILPGLSGAFLLLVLGVYDYVLNALVSLDLVTIVVFASGCGFGLLAFSRMLSWALRHYRESSYAFLTGMLLASLYVLWPWQQPDRTYQDSAGDSHVLTTVNVWPHEYEILTGQQPQLLSVLLALLAGIALIVVFDKLFRNSVD